MTNQYYNPTAAPAAQSRGASSVPRAEFASIGSGFALLPTPANLTGSTQSYGIDTGSVNAVIVPLPTNLTAAFDGMKLSFRAAATNTAAATITVGALASVPIVRPDGTTLLANDYVVGQIVEIRYQSAQASYQLLSLQSSAASASSAAASATAAAASAVTSALQAASLVSTSTTSLAIAVASKSFTTQTLKQYAAGQFVVAISAASSANWMIGQVTSYNSGSGALVLDVQAVGGSGTHADWNLSISGSPGAAGAAGVAAATTQQTLTDASTTAWDWSLGRIAVWTLGANRTAGLPTNLVTDTFILKVVQGSGGQTVTWNSIYKWSEGVAPTLSTVASRIDVFTGYYDGTSIHIGMFSRGSR